MATYGFPSGMVLDYLTYCQLVLNVERVHLRDAVAVGLGLQSVMSSDILGDEWADSVAQDESEVNALALANQRVRATMRLRTRMGW